MRKIIASFLLSSIIMTGSSCFGALSADHLMLGEIKYGATISDVEKQYGKPLKIDRDTEPSGEKIEYKYGNSIEFEFINGKLQEITVEDKSNAKTKAGIGIGTDVATLKSIYGEPDKIHEEDYIYFIEDMQGVGLKFEIKNGTVHEISCGLLD
jgi:hypothetical protein